MTQLADCFDTDSLINDILLESRKVFESWAAIGGNELPEDHIDAMQVQLMRWQRAKFGDQSDERMVLGIIEEVTESDISMQADETLDALGDATVYSSQLLTNNRLAVRPVLALVQTYMEQALKAMAVQPKSVEEAIALQTSGPLAMIGRAQGMLAQVTIKGAQKVRGLDDRTLYHKRLIGSVAWCLVRCASGATVKLGERVNTAMVFATVGAEVCQRGAGHDAIPKLTVH